jgi:hypothetical protein
MPQTRGPEPYEWLLDGLERYAAKAQVTRSTACCMLLARGVARDLSKVRVLRPRTAYRAEAKAKSAGVGVPAFSISAEYADLADSLEGALKTLKAQHVERAQAAMRVIAEFGLSKATAVIRGWRASVKAGKSTSAGVVLHFAGNAKLPESAMIDACDCITDDMTTADVMRALWAAELEREKLAPKGWADLRMVGYGVKWIQFQDRELC